MGKYTGIKSKSIKEKIKETKWKDKDYIDELILLEEEIIHVMFRKEYGDDILNNLMKRHPKEYKSIYAELKPKDRKDLSKIKKEEKEAEKREEKEIERDIRKMEREEKQDKKNWIKAKGKK